MADEKSNPPQRTGATAAGRGMPHSVEAEEYLLSCCLIDGAEVLARCLEARIVPESFFVPAHGIVFERLLDLYNRQAPSMSPSWPRSSRPPSSSTRSAAMRS